LSGELPMVNNCCRLSTCHPNDLFGVGEIRVSSDPTKIPDPSELDLAIVSALAYADVFDYPLTVAQIHRYLVRTPATVAQVEAALVNDPWLASRVEWHGDLVCLRGRSVNIALRHERASYAGGLWRSGCVFAWLGAHLPYVRMVAVIGSLTMDNVRSPRDDIDLFIVTAPGRVWLGRALVIALVRLAALLRIDLCPNYVLSTRRLAMSSDDLFTARELTQMIPLFGRGTFDDLHAANRWLERYLPNAAPRDEQLRDLGWLGRGFQRLAEWPLNGALGARLERALQHRKLAELAAQASVIGSREVLLEAEICKGHMDSHGSRIRVEYDLRRQQALAPDNARVAPGT
jgi:hypothetical protein